MTITLMRGSDLIGRVVVDASSGDDLAEVDDVVFTADRGALVGFTLRRRGFLGRRLKTVLPIAEVLSVGTDAVMVADATAITEPSDGPGAITATASNDVRDAEVFTLSGRSLGTVRDVIVLGGPAPRVVGFEVAGSEVGSGLIPLGAQASISASALVVPDDFEQRIRGDLTGLAAELSLIETSAS
jgi:uncharacterized protein YrrD